MLRVKKILLWCKGNLDIVALVGFALVVLFMVIFILPLLVNSHR